jgi:Ni/Co efflux regulator RcnB
VYADDVTTSVVREGVKGAFHEFERQMINKYFYDYVNRQVDDDRDYSYEKKKKKKSKKKGLPPGIAKKLERGGTLPPGIAKRYLPDDLNRDLPEPPDGYEHIIVGNDVLSVEIDTGKIADIITDVILGE